MKVMIVDEYKQFSELLGDYLTGKIEQLNIQFLFSDDYRTKYFEQWKPDIILLLTDLTGPEDLKILNLVRQFQLDWPVSRIVIYGQCYIDLIRACFQLGIKGWITPDTSISELGSCFLKVSNGERYLDTSTLVKFLFVDEKI